MSDWSSDVCSSDLWPRAAAKPSPARYAPPTHRTLPRRSVRTTPPATPGLAAATAHPALLAKSQAVRTVRRHLTRSCRAGFSGEVDRKRDVKGTSVAARDVLGGGRAIHTKNKDKKKYD